VKDRAADGLTLVLAIVIAALVRADGLVVLVLSYGGAWLLVNVARVVGWPREAIALPKLGAVLACALVLALPVRELAARAGGILEHEALASPMEHIADRLALEADPAIAPALVSGDRPQTYFVRASGSHVRARLGEGLAWIEAEGMGHGVFRVEYDPLVHGALEPEVHESIARVEVDGVVHARTMLAVAPLPHPRWLRTSPDRTRACVPSEETDEVLVLAVDHEPEHVETLDAPSDCAITDAGTLYVAHRHALDVLRLDAAGARTTLAAGGLGAAAIDLLGDTPCIARDGATPEVRCLGRARLPVPGTPLFLARVPSSESLVLATRSPAALHRIDLVHGALVVGATRMLTAPAAHLDVQSTLDVALGDYDADGRPELGNHFVQDRLASFELTRLALSGDHSTAWRTDRQDHAGDVDRGASPMGISRTPRGTRWVAFAGTDEVEELGGASPRVIDTARFGVSAPFSVVELSDGSLVVSSPSSGLVVLLAHDGTLTRSIALAPSDAQLLRANPASLQLRFGERAFYEATRSGVSCQSCHLHGGTDGARHNIGGRIAAPTLDVRGLLGTAPYLRDGSYPRLRDLHEVALTEYRGYRESAGDRGATLEAWMRTLPPPPTFERREPDREREGLDVFVRAGCPECHAPPAFTSLGLHAIQAVFPDAPSRTEGRLLDVPSLRGLALSAPYLYDGRAETLESVLVEHNAPDRHGHTGALTPDERAALVTFLRSL
jgi:hypothetical protein